MDGVEAMGGGKEIGRRFRGTADTGELRDPMGWQVQLKAGLDDGAADAVMAAASAKGRDRALIIPAREPPIIGRKPRMLEFGFGDIGHDATPRKGTTFWRSSCLPMASAMKRAVIGVPS